MATEFIMGPAIPPRGFRNFSQPENPNIQGLVTEAGRGNTEAFGQLYVTYVDRIYNYTYSKTGHSSDAEDITEGVFMNAWEAMPRFKERAVPFGAWLYKIAHNLVIDHYRTNKDHAALEEAMDLTAEGRGGDLSPEKLSEQRAIRQNLVHSMGRLTNSQAEVIKFYYFLGLDHSEIAAATGKDQGAVRALKYRALHKMRTHIEVLEAHSETDIPKAGTAPPTLGRNPHVHLNSLPLGQHLVYIPPENGNSDLSKGS